MVAASPVVSVARGLLRYLTGPMRPRRSASFVYPPAPPSDLTPQRVPTRRIGFFENEGQDSFVVTPSKETLSRMRTAFFDRVHEGCRPIHRWGGRQPSSAESFPHLYAGEAHSSVLVAFRRVFNPIPVPTAWRNCEQGVPRAKREEKRMCPGADICGE